MSHKQNDIFYEELKQFLEEKGLTPEEIEEEVKSYMELHTN